MKQRKQSTVADRHYTAIHEAGHAVVGRYMSQVCGGASIVSDGDSAGHAIAANPYATWWQWELRGKFRLFQSVLVGRMITLMAGAEAEGAILGMCSGGDEGDRYQIAEMLEEHGGDPTRLETRLRSATRQIVRRHREIIEAVGAALMRANVLSDHEIDAMIPGGPPLFRLAERPHRLSGIDELEEVQIAVHRFLDVPGAEVLPDGVPRHSFVRIVRPRGVPRATI